MHVRIDRRAIVKTKSHGLWSAILATQQHLTGKGDAFGNAAFPGCVSGIYDVTELQFIGLAKI